MGLGVGWVGTGGCGTQSPWICAMSCGTGGLCCRMLACGWPCAHLVGSHCWRLAPIMNSLNTVACSSQPHSSWSSICSPAGAGGGGDSGSSAHHIDCVEPRARLSLFCLHPHISLHSNTKLLDSTLMTGRVFSTH